MTEVWVLTQYKAEPAGLVIKSAHSTLERAREAAGKHAGESLSWKDTSIILGPGYGSHIGWSAYLGRPVNTIYEATRLEVDAE